MYGQMSIAVRQGLLVLTLVALGRLHRLAPGRSLQHQHAVAGLGTVDFPTSCNASAQNWLSRGAALLHSFGYEEARLAFSGAAKADPSCAIAHWGVARTWYHPIWAPPSPDELKQGAKRSIAPWPPGEDGARARLHPCPWLCFYKDWQTVDHASRAKGLRTGSGQGLANAIPTTTRRRYSTRCNWSRSAISTRPIRHTLGRRRAARFSTSCCRGIRTIPAWPTTSFTAWITRRSPNWGLTGGARLREDRAGFAARAAYAVAHLHSPGIVGRLHRSNIASAKSAVAQAQRLHGGGGASTSFTRSTTWSMRIFSRRRTRARSKLLAEMAAITWLDENQFAAAYAFAAAPARWALERHDWKAAAALAVKPAWFPWNRFRNAEALVHYAKAIGAARAGDSAGAAVGAKKSRPSVRLCRQPATTIGAARSARSGKPRRR